METKHIQHKFLGIIIDEHLTWKYQINHITKKVAD